MKGLLMTLMLLLLNLSALADEPTKTESKDAKEAQAADSDKLDLKKLEDKYWASKDTDFSVVQNRTYTKEHRPFLSIGYGPLVNDEWSVGRMTNIAAGYYFSERWGMELAYETGDLKKNDGVSQIEQYNGLHPNYNKFVSYTSANLLWVPFYAKMSFLDKSIVYFDIQFGLGLGSMKYENQIDPTEGLNETKNAFGYNFDFTQQLFFSQHFAIRLDVKNKWSNQDLERYRQGTGGGDRSMGTSNRQDTSFLLGLTYFFK